MSIESNIFLDADDLRRRAAKHAALADPARLAIVDALTVSDVSPSQLQQRIGIRSNLLAHHLKVLEDEGILTRRRSEGDRRRTYLSLVRAALDGIMPGGTHGSMSGSTPALVGRVVFVCTDNTARSQLAAALWQRTSRTPVASAGTHPAARVDPGAVAAARRHGLPWRGRRPRALTDVVTPDDVIITVCDRAHEELKNPSTVHWSIPDPVPVGTVAAFDAAFEQLRHRVEDLSLRIPQPN